jgi:hypothetical protein
MYLMMNKFFGRLSLFIIGSCAVFSIHALSEVRGRSGWIQERLSETRLDRSIPLVLTPQQPAATLSLERATSTESTDLSATTTFATIAELRLGPQPAGNWVTVDSLSTNGSTWVVVFDKGGLGDTVLGAQLVDEGSYSSVTVQLLAPLSKNLSYTVALYADDGDTQFSKGIDSLITPTVSLFTVY